MWPFKKKKTLPELDPLTIRTKWIGRTIIVSKTTEIIYTSIGTMGVVPQIANCYTLSGKVTEVGVRTIKIDDTWYETDHLVIGGVRIVEVI